MCFIRLGWYWVLFALRLQLHALQEHGEQPLLYWHCSCLQGAYACTWGLAALTQNFVRAHRRWLSCWFTDVESLKEIESSQPTKASGRFHEALAEAEFFVHHYIWPLQLGRAGDLYHLNVERHVFNLQTFTLSGCTQCVYYREFVEKLPKMDGRLVLG
jgi:hypothetical protein